MCRSSSVWSKSKKTYGLEGTAPQDLTNALKSVMSEMPKRSELTDGIFSIVELQFLKDSMQVIKLFLICCRQELFQLRTFKAKQGGKMRWTGR